MGDLDRYADHHAHRFDCFPHPPLVKQHQTQTPKTQPEGVTTMATSRRVTTGAAARQTRQTSAHTRAENRSVRTASEQISALDARLGVGVGATRERARLASTGGAPKSRRNQAKKAAA